MKYIRMEDEILDTKWLVKCNDERIENGWFTKNGVPIIAIKQADTIEELCDRFVLVDYYMNNCNSLVFRFAFEIEGWLRERMSKMEDYDIRGAIWTDKGLIYVAKMNDKGKLELLELVNEKQK